MAFLDVLSQENHLNVNIKVIKLFGIKTALYWSVLSMILPQVQKKNKLDEFGYFTIDRKYVTTKTTLTPAEQKECEKVLAQNGIIAISDLDVNKLSVNSALMLEYIIDVDPKDLIKPKKATTKVDAEEKKALKKAGMVNNLCRYIQESDEEVRQAYCDWIKAMIEEKTLNSAAVVNFESNVNNYTTDKLVKLKLLELAATYAYREFAWVEKVFKDLVAKGAFKPAQKICTQLDTSISF
jgi:hypothetical protein